jgi:hypothetical protein
MWTIIASRPQAMIRIHHRFITNYELKRDSAATRPFQSSSLRNEASLNALLSLRRTHRTSLIADKFLSPTAANPTASALAEVLRWPSTPFSA